MQDMRTPSVEDLSVVDSDCLSCHGDSPIDMSFVATSPTASINNESPSSPVRSTFTGMLHFTFFPFVNDITDPSSASITLDSFVPILKHLPGFYLDENQHVSPRMLFGKIWLIFCQVYDSWYPQDG